MKAPSIEDDSCLSLSERVNQHQNNLNKIDLASYKVTQHKSPAQERDHHCNSLAQEEHEGRDKIRKYIKVKKNI